MSTSPPHEFFRVHHRNAFTSYRYDSGFQMCEPYQASCRAPAQWFNKTTFEAHATDVEPAEGLTTPFISMFDNFVRACDLAQLWRAECLQDVFIAHIRPGRMDAIEIELKFEEGTLWLPAWMSDGVIMVSTSDVRFYLGVEERKSDLAEWFVIEEIPVEWISVMEDPSIMSPPAAIF